MNRSIAIALLFAVQFLSAPQHGIIAAEKTNHGPNTIAGTWRWQFTMPDGSKIRPKLTLTLDNGKLIGSTSFRPGTEVPITNAVLAGNQLSFQVVRQRDEKPIITRYSGQWNDKFITGKIESNWAGETQSFDWQAERSKIGAEGIWRWTNSLFAGRSGGGGRGGRGGRASETRLELAQDGDKLTGKTIVRVGQPVRISNGSITNNEVYFEIERSFGGEDIVIKYQGKQTGDVIRGTMEFESETEFREGDWEAKRID